MPRRIQQTKNEEVRSKHRRYRNSVFTREEQDRRDRWLKEFIGRKIRRRRGHVVYRVVGPDQVPVAWGKLDVVRLAREDGSELTVGYEQAMGMEKVS